MDIHSVTGTNVCMQGGGTTKDSGGVEASRAALPTSE